eukprot:1330967-Amorphochlora_amoeboformis.AAC.1
MIGSSHGKTAIQTISSSCQSDHAISRADDMICAVFGIVGFRPDVDGEKVVIHWDNNHGVPV